MTEHEPSKTWEKIMEETSATATRDLPWNVPEETIETGPSTPYGTPPPPPPPADSPPRRWGRSFMAPLLAALLGAGVGTGVTFVALDDEANSPLPDKVVVQSSGGSLEAVAAVAKAVLPSIVRIDVDAGFESGTGSGVIYREDGYIITNNHVVEGSRNITVTLSNGEELAAEIVGSAGRQVDIAVLKVDRSGLPAATLGDTHELEVGDLAVALGSPFGLQSTVTAGVVSALHRNISFGEGARFSDAIQTDAPINPGNSGGALANSSGEVVGINTAIVPGAGGNVGVGFAIPIEIAKRVADQIISTGRAQLPFLGISGQNLPEERGALIQEIVSGGPAGRAGLREGDIIVELDGQAIHSMDELISTLIQKEVGQTVTITYERDGDRRTAEARLAARPEGS
ncbi:MAG: S1C family serine protease [Actinomycetota bacterium]